MKKKISFNRLLPVNLKIWHAISSDPKVGFTCFFLLHLPVLFHIYGGTRKGMFTPPAKYVPVSGKILTDEKTIKEYEISAFIVVMVSKPKAANPEVTLLN